MPLFAVAPGPARAAVLACSAWLLLGSAAPAVAQGNGAPPGRAAGVARAEEGPRWQDLSAAQRSALKPLEREWSGIDGPRKHKWVEIATRFPSLPPAEQSRISARMTQWAAMSPTERGRARLNFQETRELAPEERRARWQAYQALTPEQRRQLAAKAEPGTAARAAEPGRAALNTRATPARDLSAQSKSNIVPNPALAAPPRPVAPTVVQAQPGATTSLMSKRPLPPSHQQPGLPKIAATSAFVDKATLLPQRGPQGAATRPAAGSASSPTRSTGNR